MGTVTPSSIKLPPISDYVTIIPQPEDILAHRVIQKNKYRPKPKILVKWIGIPAKEAT